MTHAAAILRKPEITLSLGSLLMHYNGYHLSHYGDSTHADSN